MAAPSGDTLSKDKASDIPFAPTSNTALRGEETPPAVNESLEELASALFVTLCDHG
jgi:hypothetical protein